MKTKESVEARGGGVYLNQTTCTFQHTENYKLFISIGIWNYDLYIHAIPSIS